MPELIHAQVISQCSFEYKQLQNAIKNEAVEPLIERRRGMLEIVSPVIGDTYCMRSAIRAFAQSYEHEMREILKKPLEHSNPHSTAEAKAWLHADQKEFERRIARVVLAEIPRGGDCDFELILRAMQAESSRDHE